MLLKNAEVFFEGTFQKLNLLIRNGKIEFVPDCFLRDNIMDLTGHYIIPGLVDIHTHGCLGLDFVDANAQETERMCRYYAQNGVTSIIKTIMTAPLENMFSSFGIPSPINGAHIQGVRLEGPFLNPAKRGAHKKELLRTPDPLLTQRFLDAAQGRLRIIDIAPELEGAIPLINRLSGGVRISIAHTTCTYSQALDALNAGAVSFTHLFNAMEPLRAREPGCVGAFMDSAAWGECIGDLFHVHSINLQMLFRQSPKRLALISDSVAAGLKDGQYTLNGRPITVRNRNAFCPDGTIAGSSVNLFQCFKNAVNIGIPLEQAILSCTQIPAQAAGIDHLCGSLLPGRSADLVIMNKALEIKAVYISGKAVPLEEGCDKSS